MRYRDRRHAGEELAAEIRRAMGAVDPEHGIVLGVPRGGVVVASAVAEALGLPLDIALAAKLGAPHNSELAIGAVGVAEAVWLNDDLITRLGVSTQWISSEIGRRRTELATRRIRYGRTGDPTEWVDRTVIVVDDGVATGATLAVVLHAVVGAGPRHVVCAVPVASRSSIDLISAIGDVTICPLVPKRFTAVGSWYQRFDQTTHEEVIALLVDGGGTSG